MTIKEMEERSGMTRANIRFYEKEGLLHPRRQENGYRDYSEADLQELLKIKLLRAVELPMEEIKAAQDGSQGLTPLLQAHLPVLAEEQRRLDSAAGVCQQMCRDEVQYENLQAESYLQALHHTGVPREDAEPRVTAPWRRYFARMLDFAIYDTAIFVLLGLLTDVNLLQQGVGMSLLSLASMLAGLFLVEPLLLHCWGTTPGKWILGLRVTDPDGSRLSFSDARARAWDVFASGYGFNLPIYSLYRLWKCLSTCEQEPLPWEQESVLTLKDEKPWRTAAYVLCDAALLFLTVLTALGHQVPAHRGDLTLEEFVENFNAQARREGIEMCQLNLDGTWRDREEDGVIVIDLSGWDMPDYTYTFDGERLTSVTLELHLEGQEVLNTALISQKALPVLALARAQGPVWPLSRETAPIVRAIQEKPATTWTMEAYGATVQNQVRYNHYNLPVDGYLIAQEGETPEFYLKFTVSVP